MTDFERILDQLGWPPIFLVSPRQFRHLEGDRLDKDTCGMAAVSIPSITISGRLSRRARINTLWHEIGHVLFPHRPHWWIECFAQRMGGGELGYYSRRLGHGPDELPPRRALLRTARRASQRLRRRYGLESLEVR